MHETRLGITQFTDNSGTTQFHSEKQFYTVPAIEREYWDKKVEKDKPYIRMYECAGDRHFIADIYDKNFKVTKTEVKPKGYRDNNYNYQGGGGRK